MEASIISTSKIDKTFEGVECLLKRTIVSTFKEGGFKRYVIRTHRCNYINVDVPQFDESGEPVLDEKNEQVTAVEQQLQVIDQKDKESIRTYTFAQINGLYEMIKADIPSGLSKMETETLEEQLALLALTQQDQAWGTTQADWEILTDSI